MGGRVSWALKSDWQHLWSLPIRYPQHPPSSWNASLGIARWPLGQNCSWLWNMVVEELEDVLTTKSEFLCEELPLFIKINSCAYSPIIKTGLTACVLSQSWPTLCDPVDCSPPGSSVHGVLQARILEWAPCPPPGDLLNLGVEPVSLISPTPAGRFFTTSAIWEAPALCGS